MLAFGCSGSGNRLTDPLLPGPGNNLTSQNHQVSNSQTHLWAYYDVFIDPATQTVEVAENRHAFFTANVTNFLNGKPASLAFHINETPVTSSCVDIDIDVSITHPFPGLPQYNGYDVRGIFMGDGSAAINTSGAVYPLLGTDQYMLDDPDVSGPDFPGGGPDGYTRWYNYTEFSTGGMPLFQYTPGKLASKNFAGTATLCPYKYFADGLAVNDDVWTFLSNNPSSHGVFSTGVTNKRNYYLRFPNTKGIKYGYAVIANWSGTEPQFHPSNAPEAIASSVDNNSTVYYANSTNSGGDINLDISLWGWSGQPSAMYIESTVLNNPYPFSPSDMVPVGGNEAYSTWHVEIPTDNVTGLTGNEYWIIAEYNNDYSNVYGVGNLIETEPLRAYFRYDLPVISGGDATLTVITPNGGEAVNPGDQFDIAWTSSGVSGNVSIDYSKDNFVSDIVPIIASTPNTGSYQWTVPCDPSDTVRVRVSSIDFPMAKDASDADFTIIGSGWAQTWGEKPTNSYCGGSGVAVDNFGNVYVCGKYNGTTDFDPGPTTENHDTAGGYDIFLSKYSICGVYQWTITFGGTGWENNRGVAVDSDGNVYLSGYFPGTVDFDPDPIDTANKSSNGDVDCFLVKYTPDGDFVWVRTWGGSLMDYAYDLVCDNSGNVYTTGWFYGSANFDSTGGNDVKASNGGHDCFLSKYTVDGAYIWTKTWGGPSTNVDWGTGVDLDSSGNVYCVGWFSGTVDFDPGSGTESYTAPVDPGQYLTAFDSSGNHSWARTWGCGTANNWDFGPDLCVRGSDIAVTSRYIGTVDFDPGAGDLSFTSNGGCDVCVSKFLTDGTFNWAVSWGGGSDEVGRGAAIDASGNIYISAEFNGTVDFDPSAGVDNHTTVGNLDNSMSKFDSSGNFLWARTWGAWGNDRPGLIAVDSSGNPYMTGYLQGLDANFAPSGAPCNAPPDLHSSHGECDSFIVKYFPDGCW
jgi:hypothetical protein